MLTNTTPATRLALSDLLPGQRVALVTHDDKRIGCEVVRAKNGVVQVRNDKGGLVYVGYSWANGDDGELIAQRHRKPGARIPRAHGLRGIEAAS